MRLKNIIKRHFTEGIGSKSVFDLFDWKLVDITVNNWQTGEVIFELKDAEFPSHFSDTACRIIASNYFRKNVPFLERGKETSYKQVVHRMVQFWVSAMVDEKLIEENEERQIVYDELVYMLINQMWAPNSPQWFNTGLFDSYSIKGEGRGHYHYDTEVGKVVESQSSYVRTQGSACFILGVEDALLGPKSITDNLTTETRLFKFGSGVGSNFSGIRAEGEKLSGGGVSSGLMSFLKTFDTNAGAIKSGGTTRRAAKMVIIDDNHPDVEEVATWKAKEEQKVRDLGKMGYDTSIAGEAYNTVGGQNSNNSIRVTDAFMKAVENNEGWELKNRTDGSIAKIISARTLWEKMCKSAWECGDPGIQFHDTINEWNTCKINEFGEEEDIKASNPCSEYMFLDDTACNLASLNLMTFVKDGRLDIESYEHCIGLVHLVLEATIHWGQFPTEDIARRSHLYRTTGMGYTNLGGLLMSMAIPYGSELACDISAYLMSVMTARCYLVSSLIAKEVGTFEVYDANKETILNVLENHTFHAITYKHEDYSHISYCKAMDDYLHIPNNKDDHTYLTDVWKTTTKHVKSNGIRNAQVTVLAPTGTIAFAMDCASTSSEPFFSHIIYKKVVDGSTIQMINPLTKDGLKRLGYDDECIAEIQDHLIATGSLYGAPYLSLEELRVFKVANDLHDSMTVSAEEHLKMVSRITQQLSGAISKTVNLPSTATVEDIADVYMKAWKMGIKAITVYRDGSKVCQPLNLSMDERKLEDLTYQELLDKVKELDSKTEEPNVVESPRKQYAPVRVKPHGIRKSNTHECEIDSTTLYITVSKYEDDTPCEIYVSAGRQGSLIKGMLEALSVTISKMLQFGVPVSEIAKMYRGTSYTPNGFVGRHPYIKMCSSIGDLISKILEIEVGDYSHCQVKPNDTDIRDLIELMDSYDNKPNNVEVDANPKGEIVYGKTCQSCGADKLVKNGSCYVCSSCGKTTGCS